MKQFAVLLSLTLGFSLNTEAQSFLNDLRTDKAGQGTVTVSQSKDIDELVNNAKLIKSAPTTATNEKSNNATAATEHKQSQHKAQEMHQEAPARRQTHLQ